MPAGHEVLVRKLATGDADVGLDLAAGLSIHKALHDARARFPAEVPVLPAYQHPPLPERRRHAKAA